MWISGVKMAKKCVFFEIANFARGKNQTMGLEIKSVCFAGFARSFA